MFLTATPQLQLHYCELPIRRAIPLALALLYVSNPDYPVVDQMSRLTHDNDQEVAKGAIIGRECGVVGSGLPLLTAPLALPPNSVGLLGAGTNNSRVAG